MKRIISLTLISALLVSVCSCSTADSEETYIESVSPETAVTEPVEVETSVTETSETTEETLEEVSFTVETRQYLGNPLYTSSMNDIRLGQIYVDVSNDPNYDYGTYLGFDNDYSVNRLRQYIEYLTGEENDTATLADVGYFQHLERSAEGHQDESLTHYFNSESTPISPYSLAYVRAIMQINGWRFLIDEVPFDYISTRFPNFLNHLENEEWFIGWQDRSDPDICDVTPETLAAFNDMFDYDETLFDAIVMYNDARMAYIYDYPFGVFSDHNDDVTQVRDEATGRNVLVPTMSQHERIMQEINAIPGCENVDIGRVETRENFYEAYGCYPEDLINDTMIYEPNRTEVYDPSVMIPEYGNFS